jgi:hypothetical protein
MEKTWSSPRPVALHPAPSSGALAADLAHLCTQPADESGEHGCPAWPACLHPNADLLAPLVDTAHVIRDALRERRVPDLRPAGRYRGVHRARG